MEKVEHSEAVQKLDELRGLLEQLREHLQSDVHRLSPDSASPGSEFRRDLRDVEAEFGVDESRAARSVIDLQEMCALGLLATSSHLFSISRIVRFPVSLGPIQVLCRTMMEIGARNNWLMDPQVSTRERVTRAVTEAIHGTQEDARAIGKFENDKSTAAAQQWVDLAVAWAHSLDLETRREKSGRISLVGSRRPSSSQMVEEFVEAVGGRRGAALYAYFSAATHGQAYHLAQLGGESVQIPSRRLSEVCGQLQLAVQIMKVVHIRYALYMGKESLSRIRSYENVYKLLDKESKSSAEVGQF